MIEFLGVLLALSSILPVASQRVDTCVTTSLGLGVLCVLGIALATGTGHDARWLLLVSGLSLTLIGGYLQGWHRKVIITWRPYHASAKPAGHRLHGD